jgi:hypothetical protein
VPPGDFGVFGCGETFATSPAWRRRRHSGAVGGQGLGSCSFILRFIAAGRGMAPAGKWADRDLVSKD